MPKPTYRILNDADIDGLVKDGKNTNTSSSTDGWGKKFLAFIQIADVKEEIENTADADMTVAKAVAKACRNRIDRKAETRFQGDIWRSS
jgi:hypothetical protein